MKRIVICSASIEIGDAITNDVLGMQRALLKRGAAVSICTANAAFPGVEVRPLDTVAALCRRPEDIFIYHFATGWDPGLQLLKTLPCRKIVKYHNVTPPDFFEGIDQGYVDVCRAGRAQLQEIARMKSINAFLADSAYNGQELVDAGAPREQCWVVRPFHHIERLFALDADLATLDKYDDADVSILTVGRLAPNKDHGSLLEAFAAYQRGYNRKSRLVIVGGQDPKLGSYTMRLKARVRQLGLGDRVVFTGKVTDAQLKAHYLTANVFMTTSRHEGFCVPLIEAMSMKIPVVAYATSAIPETIGAAGIAWEEHDPGLLAGSVDAVVRDDAIGRVLGEMGARRYREQFANCRIEEDFMAAVEPVL